MIGSKRVGGEKERGVTEKEDKEGVKVWKEAEDGDKSDWEAGGKERGEDDTMEKEGKRGAVGEQKQGREQSEKLDGKKLGEERKGVKKKTKGVKRVLVVRGSMIRGIEDLGELLGKGFEVKVEYVGG